VKSLEYLNLDGIPEAEALKLAGVSSAPSPAVFASSPAVWAPLPPAVEAHCITLWESAAALPQAKGVIWENGTIHVAGASPNSGPASRDAILRAAIRGNPGSAAVMGLRAISDGPAQLRLSLDAEKQTMALRTSLTDALLAEWPLPHAYADTEWLHVELRAIGDEFAVLVDGKLLGTAHSDALRRPGKAMIYAGPVGGYFRDISYIPLDGIPEAEALKAVGVSASPSPQVSSSASASAFPPGQWIKPLADLSKLPNLAEFKDGWARLGGSEHYALLSQLGGGTPNWRDGGIRARRKDPSQKYGPLLALRHADGRYLSLQYYPVDASHPHAVMQLREYHPELFPAGGTPAQAWSANVLLIEKEIPPIRPEFTTEMIIIGHRLIGRINEQTITCSVDDGGRTGQPAISSAFRYPFRDLEVINLDGIPEAEALKLVGVSAAPSPQASASSAPSASPQWREAFAEAPLKDIIAKADHNDRGWLLPPGNHWAVTPPLHAGAIRVRATLEKGLGFLLESSVKDGERFIRTLVNINGEARTYATQRPEPDQLLATMDGVSFARDKRFEFMLVRAGGRLWTVLDGKVILQSKDPEPLPTQLVVDTDRNGQVHVETIEVLNLDGFPEAEALKLAGIEPSSTSPSNKKEH
jgi:hypothetical protein